jgi:hypothetical protein
MEMMPLSLKEMINCGLEIRFVSDNLRSHKKYFYAFKEFSDNRIITVDDDLFYPSDFVSRLVNLNKEFPNSVCANVFRLIPYESSSLSPYRYWKKLSFISKSTSLNFLPIGYGGVLYPSKSVSDKIFDVDFIREKCLFADDLWLKANSLLLNTSVASGGLYFSHPIVIPNSQKQSLQKTNIGNKNMNDIQWKEIVDHYNINQTFFQK